MSYLTNSEEMEAKVWRTLNACRGLSVDETSIHIQNTINKMQRKRVKRVKNRLLKLEHEKKLRD